MENKIIQIILNKNGHILGLSDSGVVYIYNDSRRTWVKFIEGIK